jgi:hypothetical protein
MPWGHHAIKVKGKSFLFLAADAETFSLSAKLPSVRPAWPSSSPSRRRPSTAWGERVGHGPLSPRRPSPARRARLWVDESYRAVAPKRLVAQLGPDHPRKRRR